MWLSKSILSVHVCDLSQLLAKGSQDINLSDYNTARDIVEHLFDIVESINGLLVFLFEQI